MAAGRTVPDPVEFAERVHAGILPPVPLETPKRLDLRIEHPDLANPVYPDLQGL
jgi:hypothetical protein